MTPLAYTLIALATYRLATDLAWEDGPFDAYAGLRGWAHMRFGPLHWFTNGVSCPICLGFWIAPLMLVLWLYAPWLVAWFAIAGTVAFLARWK